MMQVSFSEYINDIVRILILLDVTKERKSLKMTENRIKLLDYYLKFPCTMIGQDFPDNSLKWDFDEYYAFFHWQPDLIRYRQSLNYLIAKGFAEKNLESNTIIYKITDTGLSVLGSINSPYKTNLYHIAGNFVPKLAQLSDTKIEKQILEKSNIYLRRGGIMYES